MKKDETAIIPDVVDIKTGAFTYSQRIDLGKILYGEYNDLQKFEKVIKLMYGVTPKIYELENYTKHFESAIEGLIFWVEKEKELLDYKPTAEQLSAGIDELSKKTGEYGTILSIAKNFSKDPDEILQWKYGKVFGILYTDLQNHLFSERYQKVISKRRK